MTVYVFFNLAPACPGAGEETCQNDVSFDEKKTFTEDNLNLIIMTKWKYMIYNNISGRIAPMTVTYSQPNTFQRKTTEMYLYVYARVVQTQDVRGQWDEYLKKIEGAVAEYTYCVQDDCTCHASVIDDDLLVWENGISKEDLETAKPYGTHYQIINNTLYRQDDCFYPERCKGVEHFLLNIMQELPDLEFILNTAMAMPMSPKNETPFPLFSFSKVPREDWDIMFPAWTFWEGGPEISVYPDGIGRWDEQREIISKAAKKWPWEKKLNKGFFRGSRTSEERDPLIILSRNEPDLVDAQYTRHLFKAEVDTLGAEPATEIKLEDHCNYKYLFNIQGIAASFRFKHLFLCDSVVFHVGEDWLEFFYPAMKPWVHYIPVRRDLGDTKKLLQFALENDKVVHGIALRGRQFIMDHLRMEDIYCYWLKLLKRYAELLSFKPILNKSFKQI